MILTTPGLVLHTTNYSESSVIAKVFTRQLGVRSYILKGVRSSKGRTKQNLLQPLSYLDLAVYESGRGGINHVKDIHPARQFVNTACDSSRIALIFFMNEILYKTLREEDPQPEIFDFVVAELTRIDEGNIKLSTQPIEFLLRMATHLGIEPMNNYGLQETIFDLREGRFIHHASAESGETRRLRAQESLQLHYLLAAHHAGEEYPRVDSHEVLMNLLEYFGIHIPECHDFKSVDILHTLI